MKKTILHISNDYPDIYQPNKTEAVLRLVEGTPEYRHVVYSLNRKSALNGIIATEFGEDRISVVYGALPKGILWGLRLPSVAKWIIADLHAKGLKPDLVEAHKFTIEGVIGLDIARAFDVPLICDIQGYTDINLLKKKLSFRSKYKEIAKECVAVFPYAPWVIDEFVNKLGLDRDKCTCLPVVPSVDKMSVAPVIKENKLLSIFHLDGWKNKNFEGMVKAVMKLSHSHSDIILDIYGGGSNKTLQDLKQIINDNNAGKHIRLMGAIENDNISNLMKQYSAFIMPSKSESYGLVYIEALFSGMPILLNANRGISGYYDINDIGYGCDPHNIDDIAKGIQHLLVNQANLKENIAKMQKNGDFEQLRKDNILKTYKNTIEKALK